MERNDEDRQEKKEFNFICEISEMNQLLNY